MYVTIVGAYCDGAYADPSFGPMSVEPASSEGGAPLSSLECVLVNCRRWRRRTARAPRAMTATSAASPPRTPPTIAPVFEDDLDEEEESVAAAWEEDVIDDVPVGLGEVDGEGVDEMLAVGRTVL